MPPQDPYIAGASPVFITPGIKKSYISVFSVFTPYATPSDIITLPGNPNTITELQRVIISSIQSTAGVNVWDLVKRSTANTLGTSTPFPGVPCDSANPAAQSIPKKWTAAPTLGNAVGIIAERYILSPSATSLFDATFRLYDVSDSDEQPSILRSANEEIALNFKGAAVPAGLAMAVILEWTERAV